MTEEKKKTREEVLEERNKILSQPFNVEFKSSYQAKCCWDSIKFILDEVQLRQDQTGILMETLSVLAEVLDTIDLPELPPKLDLI